MGIYPSPDKNASAFAFINFFSALKNYFSRIFFDLIALSIIHPALRTILLRFVGCRIGNNSRIFSSGFIGGNKLNFGSNVVVNIGYFFDCSCDIYIKDFVRLGPYVKILTGTHSYARNVIRRGPGSKDISLPVCIERGCWIGMGAMIMPGVTIEEGCVIAAGAVVCSSTQANGLYAGVPAVRIKDLPTSDI